MKVIENSKESTVDFAELAPGDCFKIWSKLYVKSQKDQNATALTDGEARVNMCGIQVTPINAEVRIID